jgi:hypothetical protein
MLKFLSAPAWDTHRDKKIPQGTSFCRENIILRSQCRRSRWVVEDQDKCKLAPVDYINSWSTPWWSLNAQVPSVLCIRGHVQYLGATISYMPIWQGVPSSKRADSAAARDVYRADIDSVLILERGVVQTGMAHIQQSVQGVISGTDRRGSHPVVCTKKELLYRQT